MTTIQELQSMLGTSSASQATSNAKLSNQDRFLKLLVTQMQNQDPLNPMDNAEVTSQLAQLSTVNGIENLNTTLTQMAAASAAQQSLQAATLVGRDVLVSGKQLAFAGQAVKLGVDLPQSVDGMTITITDASGNLVDSISSGAQTRGVMTLEWNGLDSAGQPLPPGAYVMSARASAGNAAVTATPLVSARVESVGTAADGSIALQLSGMGSVGLTDIKRFL